MKLEVFYTAEETIKSMKRQARKWGEKKLHQLYIYMIEYLEHLKNTRKT